MTNHFYDFNFSTLVELLRSRSLEQPDKLAFTFLQNGETEEVSLTYRELDQQARAIAAQLQSLKMSGERVLLIYQPGLEFITAFLGCLYAGAIAIPAPPPDAARLKRTLPRLQAICRDAQVSLVSTSSRLLTQLENVPANAIEFQAARWLASDRVNLQLADQWKPQSYECTELAYLQYTFGSTSSPKGVAISHNNLMYHSACINQAFDYASDSKAITWMPYFHDYGLVDGLIQPLYAGIPCYVMSPLTFLKRPLRWLQAISRYRITHSQAPNFAYDYCVQKITPEQRDTLDLSCWRVAGNGAEPIRPETLEQFIATFAPCGFRSTALYPAYGLAEATLLVSTKQAADEPLIYSRQASAQEKNQLVIASNCQQKIHRIVSCGRPSGQVKVVIAHPETLTRCSDEQVGEIWLSAPGVAQGYWNRPEETVKTFQAYLSDTGEGPFLRTGDLGFIKDGELFINGRLKDLIVIAGVNHYPQDIEWTVEQSHSSVQSHSCAAFSIDVAREERLVIAAEVKEKSLDVNAVVGAIRRAITEAHEIEVYAVFLLKKGSIPKTSSGKIQRRGCRTSLQESNLEVVGQWIKGQQLETNDRDAGVSAASEVSPHDSSPSVTAIQSWLTSQLSQRLQITTDDIDPYTPFVYYGLSSREAVSLVGDLENWLSRQLSPTLIFDYLRSCTNVRNLISGDQVGLKALICGYETSVFAAY